MVEKQVEENIITHFKIFRHDSIEGYDIWDPNLTVAQAEYLCTRQNKSKRRVKLYIIWEKEAIKLPDRATMAEIPEIVKEEVVQRIFSGQIKAIDTQEAKLAAEYMHLLRSPNYSWKMRSRDTDGIINRFLLVTCDDDDERWEESYTRRLRVLVICEGRVVCREVAYHLWQTTLETIIVDFAQRLGLQLRLFSVQVKANGSQITPNLETEVGEIDLTMDCLDLEISFHSVSKDLPDYSIC